MQCILQLNMSLARKRSIGGIRPLHAYNVSFPVCVCVNR